MKRKFEVECRDLGEGLVAYGVDGTPAESVLFGLQGLLRDKELHCGVTKKCYEAIIPAGNLHVCRHTAVGAFSPRRSAWQRRTAFGVDPMRRLRLAFVGNVYAT
jgi:hypothetical protein